MYDKKKERKRKILRPESIITLFWSKRRCSLYPKRVILFQFTRKMHKRIAQIPSTDTEYIKVTFHILLKEQQLKTIRKIEKSNKWGILPEVLGNCRIWNQPFLLILMTCVFVSVTWTFSFFLLHNWQFPSFSSFLLQCS